MKKFTIFLLLAMFSLSLFTNAQVSVTTFQKTFGGLNADEANYVQQTSDEGYIITGWTQSGILGSTWDVFLIKTDQFGNILWNKTYGNTAGESGNCVQQTIDGGYIVAGEYSNGGFNRGFVVKTKPDGDTLWVKIYGNSDSRFVTIRQTFDGGYITAGGSKIFRLDSLGNIIWAKNYNELIGIVEVEQTIDGNYVAISTNNLFKINNVGDVIWSKTYPVGSAKSIQQTTDGGYIFSGINGSSPLYFGYFIKTDVNGNIIWGKNYSNGGIGNGIFTSYGRQTNNGNYVGLLINSFGGGVFYFNSIMIDSIGNFIWSKNYQDTYCYGFCIQQTIDEGFVFVGWKGNTSQLHDVYFVKTDINGISGCNETPYLLSVSNISGAATPLTLTTTSINIVNSIPVYVNSLTLTETTLCTTVGVDDNSIVSNNFLIYPNPIGDILNLEFQSNKTEKIKIEMINLLGQVVLEENFDGENSKNLFTLEVSKIPKGIYMLRIMGSEIFTKIIVKE